MPQLVLSTGELIQAIEKGQVRNGNLVVGMRVPSLGNPEQQADDSGPTRPMTPGSGSDHRPEMTDEETESSQEIVTEPLDTQKFYVITT